MLHRGFMARHAAPADRFATHRSLGRASARVGAQPSEHPSPRQAARANLLGEVHAAYVDGRGWAMSATTVRLRWQHRRLSRHADRLDQITLARLLAVHDELRARGCLPA
jgi:hypothetical protein